MSDPTARPTPHGGSPRRGASDFSGPIRRAPWRSTRRADDPAQSLTARPERHGDGPNGTPWYVGPDVLDAVRADDRLLDALARGETPAPTDPLARMFVAWLRGLDDEGAGR